ncbi:hypothetical protein QJQ45_024648 [Haematococcus lacustris]|nr:hypothetical protein QJQ45_024648 [Haematococcus lacustris]
MAAAAWQQQQKGITASGEQQQGSGIKGSSSSSSRVEAAGQQQQQQQQQGSYSNAAAAAAAVQLQQGSNPVASLSPDDPILIDQEPAPSSIRRGHKCAIHITAVILRVIDTLSLDVGKLVAFCFVGASTFMGAHNGVMGAHNGGKSARKKSMMRDRTVRVRSADIEPQSDAALKFQEKVQDISKTLQAKWEQTADAEKPAAVAIIIGSVIAQIAIGATVDAVHKLPLISNFLEFVGLVVVAVYGYRYFTEPSERMQYVVGQGGAGRGGAGRGGAGTQSSAAYAVGVLDGAGVGPGAGSRSIWNGQRAHLHQQLLGGCEGRQQPAQPVRHSWADFGDAAPVQARIPYTNPAAADALSTPYRPSVPESAMGNPTFEWGLEIREEWVAAIASGAKTVELRQYPLPLELLGCPIAIIATPSAPPGASHTQSGLPDLLPEGWPGARWAGTLVFGSQRTYSSCSEWAADQDKHTVAPGTPHAWQEDLPPVLLDDIVMRVGHPSARETLARTCFTCLEAGLLHAPGLIIALHSQRHEQLLTPRFVAAVQARTCKLTLILLQHEAQSGEQRTEQLCHVLGRLGRCEAVEMFKLGYRGGTHAEPQQLDFTPGLAQRLLDSFPRLTALAIGGYSLSCSGLASLLAHPRMAMQLQHLDLTDSTIATPDLPAPGAATLSSLFHGLKLKQLSLDYHSAAMPFPDLQPLAQHLTQLLIHPTWVYTPLSDLTPALAPLAQLQVLTIRSMHELQGLPQLLQALPQLHTLQLPGTPTRGQQQLQELLAATQLTSVRLDQALEYTASCVDLPCSWQQLELTGWADCMLAAALPLHSLTQPLVLDSLVVSLIGDNNRSVQAAVRNLTQAGKLPVKIRMLELDMFLDEEEAADLGLIVPGPEIQRRLMHELHELLQPLLGCFEEVTVEWLKNLNSDTITALAPLCQGCTCLSFSSGNMTPSLRFWQQLVQLMPTVTRVHLDMIGGATAAMCKSLRLMAKQPWARWLEIHIVCARRPMLKCCRMFGAGRTTPSKFKVCFH